MHRSDDQFPFRKAVRLINEAQLALHPYACALTGHNLERHVLLWSIYRQMLRPNPTPLISMLGIASSLRRPVETVRRQFDVLAGQGFCRRDGRQMQIADDFLEQAGIVVTGEALAAICRRLIDGLETMGFALPAGIHRQPRRSVIMAILDIYLSVHEFAEALVQDLPARNLTTLHVIGAVTVHNAAPLTHDPVLSERYGYDHTIPPDTLRRPISIRAIAEMAGMPYATIWRHVEAAEREGILSKTDDGYLLSDFYMNSPEISEHTRVKVRYVRRVLTDLAAQRHLPA